MPYDRDGPSFVTRQRPLNALAQFMCSECAVSGAIATGPLVSLEADLIAECLFETPSEVGSAFLPPQRLSIPPTRPRPVDEEDGMRPPYLTPF